MLMNFNKKTKDRLKDEEEPEPSIGNSDLVKNEGEALE